MDARRWLGRDAMALTIVLVGGVLLRVALMEGSTGVLWPDSMLFHYTARSFLAGDLYAHDAFKTPLYAVFFAGFMALGQTPAIGALMIAVQHAIGLLSTAVFYRIARQFFDTPVACASSLLFTAHALLLFYETSVLSEILFVFILSLLLWQSVRLLGDGDLRRAALVGALAGLLTLTRPVAQGLVICVVLVVIWAGRRAKRSVAAAALVAAVYVATVLPWVYVNSRTYEFWGISLGRGLGLFIRVFEIDRMDVIDATRYPLVRDVLGWARPRGGNVSAIVRDELNFRHGLSAAEADDAMFGIAMETVRAHPWTYARNTARNWVHELLVARTDPEICHAHGGPYLCTHHGLDLSTAMFPNVPPWGHAYVKVRIAKYVEHAYVRMWMIVPLALMGALRVLFFPSPRPRAVTAGLVLLLATIVYFTGVPALIQWPEERYRLPIDPLIFMFAAFGAATLADGARTFGRLCHAAIFDQKLGRTA